jgi:hypothetical protein
MSADWHRWVRYLRLAPATTALPGRKSQAHALATIHDVALEDAAQLLRKLWIGIGFLLDCASNRGITLIVLRLEPRKLGLKLGTLRSKLLRRKRLLPRLCS